MTRKIILTSILGTILLAATASAQTPSPANGEVLGTVVRGNTTTEFQAAGKSGLEIGRLKAWNEFAVANPSVVSDFGRNPSLISSDEYVNKNGGLSKLFADNPGLRDSMIANPGNYVVPTSKASQ